MVRDKRILLVVAPTVTMARDTLAEHGIKPDGGDELRMVTRMPGLRGWSHGTPVLAVHTSRWSTLAGSEGRDLEAVLFAMINSGRLRLAQDADVARFRMEMAS